MDISPEVSVIIPAKNTEKWIGEQLESLSQQKNAPYFEVIIVDNGSTDKTRQIAHDFRGSFGSPRIIEASEIPSASFARNKGAESARGRLLLFCDSDDYVSEQWVQSLTTAFEASRPSLVSGALHHEKFNDQDVLEAYEIPPDPSLDVNDIFSTDVSSFAGYLPTVPGGNFAIAKSDYLRLGGMNPDFPGGSEETDFSWRAAEAGLRVVKAPNAVVHYRLKHDFRSLFRQQRIQQYARIYLWTLYGRKGMNGPSFKWSIEQIIKQQKNLLLIPFNRRLRLKYARLVGGNIGAIQGIILFRSPVRKILKKLSF